MVCFIVFIGAIPVLAEVNIYVADHHNKTVIKIKEDGTLLWAFPNNNGHDVQLLKNGNVLIVTGEVQEVTPDKENRLATGQAHGRKLRGGAALGERKHYDR